MNPDSSKPPPGHYRKRDIQTLIWKGEKISNDQVWQLPPSKSHLIRWLLMASKSPGRTFLEFNTQPGEDAYSMLDCLKSLGMIVLESQKGWQIDSCEYKNPENTLYCGNSATTLRLLAPMLASLGERVTFDSDDNLKSRDHSTLFKMLDSSGVSLELDELSNSLPFSISGPITEPIIRVEINRSSQVLSGLIFSSCTLTHEVTIETEGELVSQEYLNLSIAIAKQCGMPEYEGILRPWTPNTPDIVQIPVEASLQAMAILMSQCHEIRISTPDLEMGEGVGNIDFEKLSGNRVNISDSIDIITPLAAIMCIRDGGEIYGASHARFKESDRITRTAEMLAKFGLKCEVTQDGLRMKGGQKPQSSSEIVDCHGDHRLFMCAAILASRYGGQILDDGCYRVSYPRFMDNLPQPCLPK